MNTQHSPNPSPAAANKRRFNYPLLMATLAVFFLISSIAFAASLPKNSVSSKQLKKNAVTNAKIKKSAVSNAKIKNSAVTSNKVKDDSLTGVDINESSLGTVPSAASTETSVGPIAVRLQSSASAVDFPTAIAQATAVPVATVGQLTLYAKCYFNTTTSELEGAVFVSTSADGAAAISTDNSRFGNPDYLNTSTLETDREVDSQSAADNTTGTGGDDRFTLIGADGRGFLGRTTLWLSNGAVPASPLVQGTRQCVITLAGDRFTL